MVGKFKHIRANTTEICCVCLLWGSSVIVRRQNRVGINSPRVGETLVKHHMDEHIKNWDNDQHLASKTNWIRY